jgi:hypothetical protein
MEDTMRRIGIIAIGTVLVVAACSSGGGSVPTSPSGGTNGPDAATPETASGPPDAGPGGASLNPEELVDQFRDEGSSAVVVVGDQRFEFDGLYCVNIGGAMAALSVGVIPSVDIEVPPEDWATSTTQDWDPPSISIDIDEPDMQLVAGGDFLSSLPKFQPGMSQVDDFSTDGYHATGTATFVDIADFTADLVPVAGTFEVTCPRP